MGSAASTLKDASQVRKREAYLRELEATVQSLSIQNSEYSKRAEVAGTPISIFKWTSSLPEANIFSDAEKENVGILSLKVCESMTEEKTVGFLFIYDSMYVLISLELQQHMRANKGKECLKRPLLSPSSRLSLGSRLVFTYL